MEADFDTGDEITWFGDGNELSGGGIENRVMNDGVLVRFATEEEAIAGGEKTEIGEMGFG